MPQLSHNNARRRTQLIASRDEPPATRCTIATQDGKFCDSPVPPDAPISACQTHLIDAHSYCQAVMDRASDAQLQVIRDEVPRLRDQRIVDRVRKARSVVYYALANGYIKIGTTVHLDQRMKTLGANLVAVEPGDQDLERDRHRQFAELLAAGREYFFPGHKLIAHVAALQARYTG